jgi:hypothetical protein
LNLMMAPSSLHSQGVNNTDWSQHLPPLSEPMTSILFRCINGFCTSI